MSSKCYLYRFLTSVCNICEILKCLSKQERLILLSLYAPLILWTLKKAINEYTIEDLCQKCDKRELENRTSSISFCNGLVTMTNVKRLLNVITGKNHIILNSRQLRKLCWKSTRYLKTFWNFVIILNLLKFASLFKTYR